MKKNWKCLLVDDHPMIRQGLRGVLSNYPLFNCDVVGEATNPDEALQKILGQGVDVVFLDHSLASGTGLDLILLLRKQNVNVKVIIFTQCQESAFLKRYEDEGVDAILFKDSSEEEIARGLVAVLRGGRYESPAVKEKIFAAKENLLTAREMEVVKLVAEGKTNKQVAVDLDCSVETVKTHKANIMRKIEVSNSVEITIWALKNGLS